MIRWLYNLIVGQWDDLTQRDALMDAVERFFETRCTCADEVVEDDYSLCPQSEAEWHLKAVYQWFKEQE